MKQPILTALSLLLSFGLQAAPPADFWSADVWRDPDRPFLFYGEEKKKEPDPKERPLTSLTTLAALKAERQRRLEAAVMSPTEQNIASYLQINAYLQEKAGRFARGWQNTLLNYPEYDWTASHPTVNAASTALSREREAAAVRTVLAAPQDTWGLVYFRDASPLTPLMDPIVGRFAREFSLELVQLEVTGSGPATPQTLAGDAVAGKTTPRGVSVFPALVLVNRADGGLKNARLVATGVVADMELTRRVARLMENREPAQTAMEQP